MKLSNLNKDDSLLFRVSELGDGYNLTRSLKVKEFKSRDGADFMFVHPGLLVAFQYVRDRVGVPLLIRSGYRSEAHNRKVNGSESSLHLYGMAIDVFPKVERDYELNFLKRIFQLANEAGCGGVKLYRDKRFVHFDVGAERKW